MRSWGTCAPALIVYKYARACMYVYARKNLKNQVYICRLSSRSIYLYICIHTRAYANTRTNVRIYSCALYIYTYTVYTVYYSVLEVSMQILQSLDHLPAVQARVPHQTLGGGAACHIGFLQLRGVAWAALVIVGGAQPVPGDRLVDFCIHIYVNVSSNCIGT